MWQILIIIGLIFLIILGRIGYVIYYAFKLPKNNPKEFLKKHLNIDSKSDKKIIAFVGDSITHGKVGTNYVDMVGDKLDRDRFELLNAGINSELAYNVYNRIDDIIKCNPDLITILIGTNDARGSYDKKEGRRQLKQLKLPRMADIRLYEEYLDKIIWKLKKQTHAKIGLISIPTIGENINEPSYKIVKNYVEVIKKLSQKYDIYYIPFYEKMDSLLKKMDINVKIPFESELFIMIKVVALKYFFKISYKKISDKIGFKFHIDYLHLNDAGANILVDLLIPFIDEYL